MMMEVCVSVYESFGEDECKWVRSRTFMVDDCDIGSEDIEEVFREDGNNFKVMINKRKYYLFCYVEVVFEIGGLSDVYRGLYRLDKIKLCDCICEKIREIYDAYSSENI